MDLSLVMLDSDDCVWQTTLTPQLRLRDGEMSEALLLLGLDDDNTRFPENANDVDEAM